DAGADVNAVAHAGNSVLMHALFLSRILKKDNGQVQQLLAAGAEINEEGKQESLPFTVALDYAYMGYTPLMLAWTLDQVKALVERGANVNAKSLAYEITPLILALGNGDKAIAQYLIEHGADVNAKSKDGLTPLSVAPDEECVKMLLAKGAEVNPVTENGILFTHVNEGKMRALLDAGFDIHTDYFNSTPLILAKDVKTAKMLIQAGYDVNAAAEATHRPLGAVRGVDEFALDGVLEPGTTALDMAVAQENAELVEFLIQSGAKIESTRKGASLILTSSQRIRDTLIQNGLDINAKDQYGYTPLHNAKRLDDAKLLLKSGAKLDPKDSYRNLWEIADVELATQLIQNNIGLKAEDPRKKEGPEHFISDAEGSENALLWTNNQDVIKLLIKAGADLNATGWRGRTVLMRSENTEQDFMANANAMGIDEETIMTMVYYGDSAIDQKTVDTVKELRKSSIDNNREIIKLLIEAGADVNASAYDGTVPLTETDDLETIQLLLAAGANPNGGESHWPDDKEKTVRLPDDLPLINALRYPEAVRLLLDAGADPNAQTMDGFTALFVALRRNMAIEKNREVARMLVNAGADINHINHITNHGDYAEETILCTSARDNDFEAVKFAIELGADINMLCGYHQPNQESILELSDNPEMVKILLAAGADPNGGNAKYNPILKLAENPESLRLLIAAGADPEAKGYYDETALFNILTSLKSLNMAISEKRESARILVQAGANINHKRRVELLSTGEVAEQSILEQAVEMTSRGDGYFDKEFIESIKIAIELGADVNVLCEGNKKLSEQTQNQEVIAILKAAGIKC
ncbi:MAG: ankyrin repeat domain-containing protein, partial [Proteobacteria bacterium]|nr:ankyrin repeat domain-containing protein [Pseudomonadota bacterium]